MNKARSSDKLVALREIASNALTNEIRAEKESVLCVWCENPGEIAKPSAPQCEFHKALNDEYSQRIYTTPEDQLGDLREKILLRGEEGCLLNAHIKSDPGAIEAMKPLQAQG